MQHVDSLRIRKIKQLAPSQKLYSQPPTHNAVFLPLTPDWLKSQKSLWPFDRYSLGADFMSGLRGWGYTDEKIEVDPALMGGLVQWGKANLNMW